MEEMTIKIEDNIDDITAISLVKQVIEQMNLIGMDLQMVLQ